MAIARTVVAVGKGLKITERGTAIALATAMQESGLDPSAVHGHSVGLFQQQGSYYADVRRTDPVDASRAFYAMLVKRVPRYDDPSTGFAEAAQKTQQSGAGAGKYAAWQRWATTLAATLYNGTEPVPARNGDTQTATPRTGLDEGTVVCNVGGGSGTIPVVVHGFTVELPAQAGIVGSVTAPNELAAGAIAAALSYLGTPYAWGGGDPQGPTRGIHDNGVADQHGDFAKIGFDCSGLTLYAYAKVGIVLPHNAHAQWLQSKTQVPYPDQSEPGDLLFWGEHHVALYLGTIGGTRYMVEAPESGQVVKVSVVREGGDFKHQSTKPWQ
ncbi:C40 family peptidase [Labedaea rhizosphaerae]|uniref:NlpC/P60 family protein n=1 Tax=Labedaea rhizosphaerae TaxID=598644 RepID=A0A4R6SG07_LABRH|nr:C40 family peptidase [Labedaea rhizosphaerae]TDQ00603.1 NlpC/P60 family protein [Labedaea rhizosphaerae]